ncbi:MAG: helix-turn-helix transcriptional regulator [Hyphomonadaceae bacterium]
MGSYRTVAIGTAAVLLLLTPSIVEFATGEATFNATGIAVELFETLTMAATLFAVVLLVNELRQMRKDRASLVNDLARSRQESLMWRENAKTLVEGAREAIDRQFEAWQFTPAEKDIATLILKGCSHKQIADIRKSTATTVRQQAQAIYRKSGLEGRSELAAYFLDAILHQPDDEAVRASTLTK